MAVIGLDDLNELSIGKSVHDAVEYLKMSPKDKVDIVWDVLAYRYFDHHPEDAVKDFLEICEILKTEDTNEN